MSKPISFAVYISRKSGQRSSIVAPTATQKRRAILEFGRLLSTQIPDSQPALQLSQLCLIRCGYLEGELSRIIKSAPDASIMVARSIVETSLVGSYLALHHQGDLADRMVKSQRTSATRLRERMSPGEQHPAFDLLTDIKFLADSLSPSLDDVAKFTDLNSICRTLDGLPPFRARKLATLLYEETYSILSAYVVHPTPASLKRHHTSRSIKLHFALAGSPVLALLPFNPLARKVRPDRIDPVGPAWASRSATLALAASLTRGLGAPSALLDQGANEVSALDGYFWSASPARMVAVSQLVNQIPMPSVTSLNLAGALVRLLATTDTFHTLTPHEQLIAASEVLDRSRHPWRLLPSALRSVRNTRQAWRSEDQTLAIVNGTSSRSTQALVAALALAYANVWPDDAKEVRELLTEFDRAAPHKAGVYSQIVRKGPGNVRDNTLRRLAAQIERLP